MTDFAVLTERQRAVWGAGDWVTMAPMIADASQVVVDHLDPQPGQDFLDVATGEGNAAIRAAHRGARVTGLDFIPAWVDAARARAQSEGVDATFVVGDAQDLPFPDDSFDLVSSVFGAMFAPDQERAAAELVRVTRPGGRIAVTAWTPEGLNGQMFMTIGKHLPPPPPGFKPPVLWGTEERIRELFAGQDVQTERRMLRMEDDSKQAYEDRFMSSLGPVVVARSVLEPEGKWQAAFEELLALEDSHNQRDDGGFRADAEYLLTTVSVG